jgi:hypothetical protein
VIKINCNNGFDDNGDDGDNMNGASLSQSLGTDSSDGPVYQLMIDECGTWQNDDQQEKYKIS